MLSVTDGFLTYINVSSFHYILLIVEVESTRVEIYDSLAYPEEKYQMRSKGNFNHYRTISVSFVQFLSYQLTNNLFIYFICRTGFGTQRRQEVNGQRSLVFMIVR